MMPLWGAARHPNHLWRWGSRRMVSVGPTVNERTTAYPSRVVVVVLSGGVADQQAFLVVTKYVAEPAGRGSG
jgi:hypothetical protein